MSQELSSLNSSKNDSSDIFVGTPSVEETVKYMMRQKRLVDLKGLEASPELESSPELSESFEMYLQQRKFKAEEERRRLMNDTVGFVDSPKSSKKAEPLRQVKLDETAAYAPDNTMTLCNDESFLLMEKLCDNTLHLQNVSENLVDLTGLDSSDSDAKKSFNIPYRADETHLFSVEAPSFMFNNTSMASPKNSPLRAVHANRPSTILEVSEACSSNRTYQSSYRTALTRSEESADYKTANEDTFEQSRQSINDELVIRMPKIRSFYDNLEMTKDSLDPTVKIEDVSAMTKDSLEVDTISIADSSVVDSLSGVDSSYDQCEYNGEERMNDTLEQIEFMLVQAQKMQEQKIQEQKTSKVATASLNPPKPKLLPASPLTPFNMKSAGKPKVFNKGASASKYSPLIKFSPVVKNSPTPATNSAFKKPIQSASKHPQTSVSASKKFQHIESPISRYIKHTPGLPLQTTARTLPGMGGSPKQFNFRDSESFANENQSSNTTYKGSSLPLRAKTKSSAVSHVYDQRDSKKTPGGAKMQTLIGNSPTVTVHQGHIKTHDRPMIFQSGGRFNETAMSEQSFADLSLISGDVSVQVIEGVKRMMK